MDIQSQHWVALDPSATPHSGSHQFVRSFNDGGKTGIFAAISEPVPAKLRYLAHNSHYYQRTQEGAEFALEAIRQALTDLIEQQLEFDVSFLDLFTKHWQDKITEHFATHPMDAEKQQGDDNAQNKLSQLAHIYDATISVVRMTEQELMVYHIGYAKILFLNEQHQIDIRAPRMDVKSPSLQFLADPDIKKTFPCQVIDVHKYGLEMLMLLPEHYASTQSTQQLHDEAYQLSHLLDIKGRGHVSTYLQNAKEQAGKIVIKRNRRWYDGLSTALDRDTHYFNDKVHQQEQQIGQLKAEIDQLTQVTNKLISSSSTPPALPSSTQNEDTKEESSYRPLYIENLSYQGEEKVHDKSRSGALIFSTLFLLFGLTSAYYLWQGEQNKPAKMSTVVAAVQKHGQNSRNVRKDTFVAAIKESTQSAERGSEEDSTARKVSMTLLAEKDKNDSNTSSTNSRQKKAEKALVKAETDIMVNMLVMHSTEFAGNILKSNKNMKEIKAMDELYDMTKNDHYSDQKRLLETRKGQLDKKIQSLSEKYSTLLKRLCSNAPVEVSSMPEQATPLERIAFTQLKNQLSDCSKAKEITAAHIGKVLRSHYRQLSAKN